MRGLLRAEQGEVRFTTRFKPKRADELIGGRLHFIIRHMIVGRVEITAFDDRDDGRVDIVCAAVSDRSSAAQACAPRLALSQARPMRPRLPMARAGSAICRPNSIAVAAIGTIWRSPGVPSMAAQLSARAAGPIARAGDRLRIVESEARRG